MIRILHISTVEADDVVEPVSLDDLKAWGNIDYTSDDALLGELNEGARQDIGNETALALVETEVTVIVCATCEDETLTLPYVISQEEVAVKGKDGEDVDEESYKLRGATLRLLESGEFTITYTTANVVPTALKQAIKMLAIYRYNNRGDGEKQQGLPEDIDRKISKYRQVWL